MTDFVDPWHLLRRAEAALGLAGSFIDGVREHRYVNPLTLTTVREVWDTVHNAVAAYDRAGDSAGAEKVWCKTCKLWHVGPREGWMCERDKATEQPSDDGHDWYYQPTIFPGGKFVCRRCRQVQSKVIHTKCPGEPDAIPPATGAIRRDGGREERWTGSDWEDVSDYPGLDPATLRGAILDIDAHATPFGDNDEDGFVQRYLITAGALHRALGLIGHTAPPCKPCLAVERTSPDQGNENCDRCGELLVETGQENVAPFCTTPSCQDVDEASPDPRVSIVVRWVYDLLTQRQNARGEYEWDAPKLLAKLDALSTDTEGAAPRLERAMRAVRFFASVIKAGEPWTNACEQAYQDALPTADEVRGILAADKTSVEGSDATS